MKVKSLLIIAVLLILLGVILKITHAWDEGANYVYIAGLVFGAIYFLMRGEDEGVDESFNFKYYGSKSKSPIFQY